VLEEEKEMVFILGEYRPQIATPSKITAIHNRKGGQEKGASNSFSMTQIKKKQREKRSGSETRITPKLHQAIDTPG